MKKKIVILLLASAIVLPALMIGGKAVRADETVSDPDAAELSSEGETEEISEDSMEDTVEVNDEEAVEEVSETETVTDEVVTEDADSEAVEMETTEKSRSSDTEKTAGIQVLIENTLQKDVTGICVKSGQKKYSANLLQEKTVFLTEKAEETGSAGQANADEEDVKSSAQEATSSEPAETASAVTADEPEKIVLAAGDSLTLIIPEKYVNEEHMYDLELTYVDGSTEELPYVMLVNKCTGKLHEDYGMALMEVQDPRLEAEDPDLSTEEIEQIEEETRETKAEILTAEIAEDAP